ncbi:hypothetical protein BOX15_Mlig021202g1 [Macrostomum lignano]|uniref:trans-L-3-hydroxyproline dehydratase n=2 Tax=Macrostomum lignano TaxID=282301 RepID=A0A1I8H593_9PLAT|nr:hypothetical protein BOX15_Mlig021202g1 [Macrostomum lignano]
MQARQQQMYTCVSATVSDMHTAGEPLRIIEKVTPDPLLLSQRTSLLALRRHLSDDCDWLRRFVVLEPRGHADMYAAYLIRPACHPQADVSVLFLHNDGYSTMCGHAVIALAKYGASRGLVEATPPRTTVNIECPCGLVRAVYHHGDEDNPDSSSFISVPAFLDATYNNFTVQLEDQSSKQFTELTLNFDLAYGGAYYVILPARQLGLDIQTDAVDSLIRICQQLKAAISSRVDVSRNELLCPDLAFIYGVILTDGRDGELESDNLCVFADGEVDRSPTGSGVTARVAAQAAKGQVRQDGVWRTFRNSKTGSVMLGRLAEEVDAASGTVRVEVSGRAFFTGSGVLTAETGDPMLPGFRVK